MGHVYPHSPSSQTIASSSAILRLSLEAPQSMAQGWLTILVPTCSKDSSEKKCCCQLGPWFRSWKTTRMHAHTHTHMYLHQAAIWQSTLNFIPIYALGLANFCTKTCIYVTYLYLMCLLEVASTNRPIGTTHFGSYQLVHLPMSSDNKPRLGILSRTHLGYQVLQASSLVLSTNEFSPLM